MQCVDLQLMIKKTKIATSNTTLKKTLTNLNSFHRIGGCAHIHCLRSTERVRSILWLLWLDREISMCQKFVREKEGSLTERSRTATQTSQVGTLCFLTDTIGFTVISLNTHHHNFKMKAKKGTLPSASKASGDKIKLL